MDYLPEIAKQGLGYLLFAGAVIFNIYQYKENRGINNSFIEYMQKYGESNSAVARDMVNGLNNMKESIEALSNLIQFKRKL